MSTVSIEPDETVEVAFVSNRPLNYVPGLLLLIVIGIAGKYAEVGWNALAKQEHWTVPDIEYVLWAIVFGLLIANTVGLHPIFRPGVQTYQFWLKVGIVALGSRFVLGDIAKLGGTALIQILVDMTVAGAIILAAAKLFGLVGKLGSLGHAIGLTDHEFVSKWALLLTFAGVGLTTDFRQLARAGWRPLVVAVIGLGVVAVVSLGLVLLTSRVFHWGVTT